jgi:hypothetical protein
MGFWRPTTNWLGTNKLEATFSSQYKEIAKKKVFWGKVAKGRVGCINLFVIKKT